MSCQEKTIKQLSLDNRWSYTVVSLKTDNWQTRCWTLTSNSMIGAEFTSSKTLIHLFKEHHALSWLLESNSNRELHNKKWQDCLTLSLMAFIISVVRTPKETFWLDSSMWSHTVSMEKWCLQNGKRSSNKEHHHVEELGTRWHSFQLTKPS